MENKEVGKEVFVVIIAALILGLVAAFRDTKTFYITSLSFLAILVINVLVKKIAGYFLETDVKIRFWSWYRYGFRKDSHFKKALPMAWLPLLITLFSRGFVWWLAILEFDVAPKTERVSRRHGLYRFTEVTETHIAWIAIWGLIANFAFAIVGYLVGLELFAKLSIFYIAWSVVPISSLDGTKIFFADRSLWVIVAIIAAIVLGWGIMIV